MFFGRYDYTIDAKGRLNFPAKFRDAMGESFVVLEWVDNCLFVLPLPEVEKLAEKLEADELMDSWEVSGDLFSTACEVVPDKQGRILLPAELRSYAGLEKDVTIIGNRNHAEIWATDVWNARRAAVVHLLFNLIGVAVLLSVFCIVRAVLAPALLDESATRAGIAVAHSVFNLLCTAMLLPAGDLLEKLAIRLVPDSKSAETVSELDERLLAAPSLALSRSRAVACEMAQCAVRALNNALRSFTEYTDTLARSIRDDEERCDHYEDILGTYLVQLSARKMGVDESEEATELLKSIGDFERISDHAVNILESAEELRGKSLAFSAAAAREYDVLAAAIGEILDLSLRSFERQDVALAELVEPLEQVIDTLKEQMRTRHILRMQQGHCSIEAGFVWSDLLTNLERTSDHCSNIAGCVIDAAQHNLNLHETLRAAHSDTHAFRSEFERYAAKYALPAPASAQ